MSDTGVQGGVQLPDIGPDEPAPAPKATQTPAAPATEAAPPWAKDFADRGIDDPRMHAYMREVAQPYSTKIEQQLKGYTDILGEGPESMEALTSLLDDLENDPEGLIKFVAQMHGLDVSQLSGTAQGEEPPGTAEDGSPDGAPPPQADDEVTSWAKQRMEQDKQAENTKIYNDFADSVKADFADPEDPESNSFDPELFRMAVISTNGDARAARAMYDQLHEQYIKPTLTPKEALDPSKRPPAPLGKDTGGRPAPNETKKYPVGRKGIEQLVDDALTF